MAEPNLEGVRQDLAFVKAAVQRRQRGIPSLATNLLWAAIILVGFSMNDWYPAGCGWFWAIAVPVAMTISGVLYSVAARSAGESDARASRATAMHWLGLGAAIGLMFVLAACHAVSGEVLGLPLLVVLALGYYLAGVHLDSSYLPAGIVMAVGAVAAVFIRAYVGTVLGVAVSGALVAGAVLRMRSHE